MLKRWRGSAILGTGAVCAVYSDDPRTVSATARRGIQHYYFRDYTADYVHSTVFDVLDREGSVYAKDQARADSVGMVDFFTPFTQSHLENGVEVEARAFAHPEDAIVLVYTVAGAPRRASYRFWARVPQSIVTDRSVSLEHSDTSRRGAVFSWSNGIALAIGLGSGSAKVSVGDLGVVFTGNLDEGPLVLVLAGGGSEREAWRKVEDVCRERDPRGTAAGHWRGWLAAGAVPPLGDETLSEAYRRNLYAAAASNLGGRIPADLTGQFLTHDMPQLYPRDALMCARAFLLAGHLDEVGEILAFWADPAIPMKSPGEWYARYDARGRAVDAGTGARYDEPEWDSNGYFIQLADAYRAGTGRWPCDPGLIFQLADFVVGRIDEGGLLFEGGIVEWSGYLPATNMINAAALVTAARIAQDLGEDERAERYRSASERISASLGRMFDAVRKTYVDVRFAGGKGVHSQDLMKHTGKRVLLWDTSTNFGPLWGYPDHLDLKQSNQFYAAHCVKLGGGMQYFDAPDPGLAGYGHDVFLFTTAAAAQYQARFGDPARARRHIDWMLENANVYGLMPERIYLDGSDCSPASPLSWCSAEFVAALLEWWEAVRQE